MSTRFEELQYCDLDWKAEQIAIDTYPGWKVTWLKKQKKVAADQQNRTKRARQGSAADKPDSKRTKAIEFSSASSASPVPEVSQQSVPTVNIIPNTPARIVPGIDVEQQVPPKPYHNFLIRNPLSNGNTTFTAASMLPAEQNLCALEWIVSNPKGTTDEFSAYYDGLPAEDKQKWEKLSVEAKESGKTPGERVMGLQS
ncbi:hypothetical protein HYPSUDRAFT_202022 [Hypholoma sublateritium FD-334 SS-4]|uniref:Uncharacterized protein n=1 Tax=Hypholoma sublateritium (strain FD-334 SS-4) TaxID=945553 RepID=A0A0D2L6V1_HYPSF|nr:hypothetical protein HYPSUDRAFT_202022 [Hypholoma sublateritium FD-334 SS-4]